MKKFILLLVLLLVPSISFAAENVLWSKDLGLGITWEQTENNDILKYNNKVISTENRIGPGYFLCTYQCAVMSRLTNNEEKKLQEIWAIENGVYNPPSEEELTEDQLNILYRITARYCENNVFTKKELGKRWIFISGHLTQMLYDTKLWKVVDYFMPEREIRRNALWYFWISLSFSDSIEYIDFLPYDGKSYIEWMDDFMAVYSQSGKAVIIDSYKLIKKDRIRVTYHLHESKPMIEEFRIVTP